jgi:hypothetical protein
MKLGNSIYILKAEYRKENESSPLGRRFFHFIIPMRFYINGAYNIVIKIHDLFSERMGGNGK